MRTGFVMYNQQTSEFNTTITQYQGTVFPQGSIHWQQNLDCEPAVGVAGLNAEDPGASSIAQNFLINTAADIVDATSASPRDQRRQLLLNSAPTSPPLWPWVLRRACSDARSNSKLSEERYGGMSVVRSIGLFNAQVVCSYGKGKGHNDFVNKHSVQKRQGIASSDLF
ncbi:hypothetical protein ABVK25_011969 [Lepraria finkii]|uniref:Cupin type-1 domain-containing protein n=1 Tax=Lepraria finkii TaxID=1340010 RepID=A0ABR4AK35_9LECA